MLLCQYQSASSNPQPHANVFTAGYRWSSLHCSGIVTLRYVTLCHVMLCHVMSCHVMSYHDMSCYVMLYCVVLCCVVLCFVVLCCVVLCCVVLCCVVLCCVVTKQLCTSDFVQRNLTVSRCILMSTNLATGALVCLAVVDIPFHIGRVVPGFYLLNWCPCSELQCRLQPQLPTSVCGLSQQRMSFAGMIHQVGLTPNHACNGEDFDWSTLCCHY